MLTLKIAFRNLFLNKVKTMIIGFIIIFGTTLAIVGNSVVDAISSGMQRSLTDSVTGEIQIYSDQAKEQLSVLGNMDGSMPDVGHVNDFARVRDTLMAKIPNIQSIIPMGTNFAMVSPGNFLDSKLEELRRLYQQSPQDMKKIHALKGHVRAILTDLSQKFEESRASVNEILSEDKYYVDAPQNFKKALAEEFWRDFDKNAEDRIEFLANTMAPLIFDDNMLFLSYIGTVPKPYKEAFSQFEIVKGQGIPDGKRGFLFNDYFYETMVKHKIARRLDQIKKRMERNQLKIEGNKAQQDLITTNLAQAAEIYSQVSPDDQVVLKPKLQKLMNSKTVGFRELVTEYLKMDDSNFTERYAFFYSDIAPVVNLYRIKIGEVFPITAFGKTGYASSVNMKVYGTYRFKSFESSPIAGNFNLMDMMSFRELYGFMTAEKREETQALEAEMGLSDLGRESVESMFQKKPEAPVAAKVMKASAKTSRDKPLTLNVQKFEARKKIFEHKYTEAEMQNGVFLNAAVTLKDPSRLSATLAEIEKVSKAEKLGIKATDWRAAAGMMGQLTIMVRGLLYFLVLVTFGIATFVIMNSMLMATLERTREIGTMRAIGAQRKFILSLLMQEAFVLSFVFGAIGTLIGVGIISTVGAKGIPAMGDPAMGDVSSFFFSGDRLYLSVNPVHILVVFVCMTGVAIISTQYPAWRAMRISPLQAMQKNE